MEREHPSETACLRRSKTGRQNLVVKRIRQKVFQRCLLYQLWAKRQVGKHLCGRPFAPIHHRATIHLSWKANQTTNHTHRIWWSARNASCPYITKVFLWGSTRIRHLLCGLSAGHSIAWRHIFPCWKNRLSASIPSNFQGVSSCQWRADVSWLYTARQQKRKSFRTATHWLSQEIHDSRRNACCC